MKMNTAIIITLIGICITGFGIFQMVQTSKAIKEANSKLNQHSRALTPIPTEEENAEFTANTDTTNNALEENYEKGRLFEEHVVSLFGKEYFEIAEWRGDKVAKDGHFATSNQYPDLEIKLNLKESSHLFAVECKFRSKASDPIQWTYPDQLKRYREFADSKGIPVFIALGVGGSPSSPQYLNIIPLSEIEGETLTLNQLKPYLKEKDSKFFFDKDKGILK